jgi:enoyl-CoA hydratase
MSYNTILTAVDGKVATITLNRPEVLNALNDELMDELGAALLGFDADDKIGCIIITGSDKAVAAGADITSMAKYKFKDVYREDFISRNWEEMKKVRKPIIAAVSGYALGGGCELAMMCDFILAADNAKFGQPEINLGILPGAGGTQRLTLIVGKGKSMEMHMTGQMIDANEALQLRLVNHVTTSENLMNKAVEILTTIQSKAPLAISKMIDCINTAVANGTSGYQKEAESFGDCFNTEDMKEGTTAFIEKRKAIFKGK